MEWGGLLRKMRTQDGGQGEQVRAIAAGTPGMAAPETDEGVPEPVARPTEPARPPAPLIPRRSWSSGAFLAAAARLVARGEEATYTLRRVVEWATAATGATHALLWALDGTAEDGEALTLLAWAATDGWKPAEEAPPTPRRSPAIVRALRNPEAVIVEPDAPAEREFPWVDQLGLTPIALCAAISSGEARGLLVVAGLAEGAEPASTFGEDARAALVACAALAAIVFERREATGAPAAPEASPAEGSDDDAEPPDAFQSLPDRAAMTARLEVEVGRARRFGHPLAVLNLDVDRFGEWSARAGEVVAKIALAHLTTIIRESIREVDLLGRGDDDSFIIILPVSEADDALRVGERIRATLARRQPNWPVVGSNSRLTLSGGAVGHPDDGTTAEELLTAAERTTAYAKRMGRDQIRMRGLGEMESPVAAATPVAARGTTGNLNGIGVRKVFQGLLDALTAAGDANDQARPGHGRAVGRYARALAEACGLDPDQVQIIELAGILHDAGKIGLPAEILGKRGPLTAEERAILREQPAVGKLMLLQVPSLEGVVPLVEHAHERFDGGGYPSGLRGNQIPFGSRIIAIAEGYEAMTSDRPYRQALSHSMAVAELWREAGGRYDPRLIDVFVRLVGAPDKAQAKESWNPQLLERVTIAPAPAETATPIAAPPLAAEPAQPAPPAPPAAGAQRTPLPTNADALADGPGPAPGTQTLEASSSAAARGLSRLLQRWPGPPQPAPADTPPATPEQPTEAHGQPWRDTLWVVDQPAPIAAAGTPDASAETVGAQAPGAASGGDDAVIVWYDDAPGVGTERPALEFTDGEPGTGEVQSLSIEHSVLIQSDASALRLAELSRLTRRRAGRLAIERPKE